MRSLGTWFLIFRRVLVAALLFVGIYDLLTGTDAGWPITIVGVLLAGFLVFRIWLALRVRRSQS